MTIKRFWAAALLFLVLFLVACGGAEEESSPTPESTPVPTPVVTPEPEPEDYRNPLTGELTETDISRQRPWAVLLNNIRVALPQNGIGQADIIYEMPVEGGITRILAVFQDIEGVGEIGPVRSARHYFLDLVQAHDAIFVFAGGSNQAYTDIRERGIARIDGVHGSGVEFFRDPERIRRAAFEHSLMTTGDLLLENVGRYDYRREHGPGFGTGLRFAEDGTPAGGEAAYEVSVRFSNVKTGVFTFDEDTGLYRVSQFGQPHIDGNTDEQIEVANVLVLFASFRVMDNEGRLDVDLNLGGEGYFISGGRAVPIRWSKGGYDAPFVYTLMDGSPLELTIGRTYVNIVNVNTGEVTIGG
ncbi:MAG: DUF3048 domain-containing protein [Oscillospiraceae bacterium]|nr:DUF3048 domain-containing protein [Oscillospiraceae bacterium]